MWHWFKVEGSAFFHCKHLNSICNMMQGYIQLTLSCHGYYKNVLNGCIFGLNVLSVAAISTRVFVICSAVKVPILAAPIT